MKHDVKILELTSGTTSIAVVDPGIVLVDFRDTIQFYNQSTGNAIVLIAESGVLDPLQSGQGESIDPRSASGAFTVVATSGIHEYQVLVTLSNGKRVFAIGASTPKIIIRSMTEVLKS